MASTTVLDRLPDTPPTPAAVPGRDLTVDLLRAVAMTLVVVGHWLVVVPSYAEGRFGGVNALETVPLMRGLSWIFQVMPLFFAIGGYAGAASWSRADSYPTWLRGRLERLLRPTVVLLAGWTGLCVVLRLAGLDAGLVRTIGGLVVVPVWFLSVYVMVTALVPVSAAAHRRFGLGALVAPAVVAAGVDAVRLGTDLDGLAVVNFGAVYLFAQQLGLWWRDGRILRAGWLALGGLGALVTLTTVGPYPVSMVGVPGEEIANNAPPTLCLVVLAVIQVGLAVRFRPALERLLTRRPAQVAAIALNRNAMTILLWHFTALVIGALVFLPLGIVPVLADGTAAWWAVRVASVVALVPVLVVLVAVAGRVERTPSRSAASTGGTGRLVLATLLLCGGFAAVAVRGLSEGGTPLGLPLVALALLVPGTLLVRSGRPPRSASD